MQLPERKQSLEFSQMALALTRANVPSRDFWTSLGQRRFDKRKQAIPRPLGLRLVVNLGCHSNDIRLKVVPFLVRNARSIGTMRL